MTNKAFVCSLAGSGGDGEYWLLTKRQFNSMLNAADPMQWMIDGGDKREAAVTKFDTVKDLFAHLIANNMEIEAETTGMIY